MISFITFFGGFVSGKQKVNYLFWALHVSKTGVSLPVWALRCSGRKSA